MLTLLWVACLELNRITGKDYRLLPFVGYMADLGINSASAYINDISPTICRRLLDGEYNPEEDYSERKYLASSWESLTARLYRFSLKELCEVLPVPLLPRKDIIAGKKPVTVYLCFPEKDLLSKAPVIRLVLESILSEMIDYFDSTKGNCRETLVNWMKREQWVCQVFRNMFQLFTADA